MSKVHGNRTRWAGAGERAIPCFTDRSKSLSNALQHLTSGKTFHGVTLTFWTGLILHYTGAHKLNTWQTSRANRAKWCNQCCCNEGNICVRKFPICSTYSGKTFVTIPSPSFVPTQLPEPLTDAVPWCLRSKTHGNDIRSENYNSTYDWCGHSMCIDHHERIVERHAKFFTVTVVWQFHVRKIVTRLRPYRSDYRWTCRLIIPFFQSQTLITIIC